MTLAVCIQCGETKIGALTPCPRCGFLPEQPEDQAKSVMLSDHYLEGPELEDVSQMLSDGEGVEYDEAQLATLRQTFEQAPLKKIPLGCQIAVWAPVIVMILLALLALALWVYLKLIAP